MSKLETLADYFHMPLDYFRIESSFKTTNVTGDNNYVGNISLGNNLLLENNALRQEIIGLKQLIAAKDQVIEADKIAIESLKKSLES